MIGWASQHILSLLIAVPLAGGLFVLLLPKERRGAIRLWALLISLITFALSLHLAFHFNQTPGYQFVEQYPWSPALGIHYHLGIDGFSLWLVILTTFLTPLTVLFSMGSIREREKSYYFFLLTLE